MELKAYTARFSDTDVIIGEKLPHGIQLVDPCYPCVWVCRTTGDYDAGIISESDDFWADAEQIPVGPVLALIKGGRAKVENLLAEQAEKVMQK